MWAFQARDSHKQVVGREANTGMSPAGGGRVCRCVGPGHSCLAAARGPRVSQASRLTPTLGEAPILLLSKPFGTL